MEITWQNISCNVLTPSVFAVVSDSIFSADGRVQTKWIRSSIATNTLETFVWLNDRLDIEDSSQKRTNNPKMENLLKED